MKSLKYLLIILCLSIGFANLAGHAASAAANDSHDPNIIIFSGSHGAVSYETGADGVLQIGVTSFYPIRKITVNGGPVAGAGDSVAEIEVPYQLDPGKNEFTIVVSTEKGSAQQTFTLYRDEERMTAESPFQLVGITSLSSLDNVASAASDEKSGTKLSLIVVPRYDIAMGHKSTLRLRGILLRERYSERDFSGSEVAYTQLLVEWLQKETGLGDLKASIGLNDIRTNNDNPLLGEDESMTEGVVAVGMRQKLETDLFWHLLLDLKLRDSKEEVTSENDEADARDAGLEAGLDFKSLGIDGKVKAGFRINDAMGDYVDSSTANLGVRVNYPLGEFVPGAGYDYREKTGKNNNAFGVKQKDKTSTLQVKVDYKWKLLPDSQLSLTWKSKNQTSNVSTSEYKAALITLALAVVF